VSRAAQAAAVCFVEEPIFGTVTAPRLDLREEVSGVLIAIPMLPQHLNAAQVVAAQRELLDGLLAELGHRSLITWYYTPMALTFTRHLSPDCCVYDNMDELSAFAGAPAELLRLERSLFSRCHVVFTGGPSLYEAKRDRHPNVHAFPSSVDVRHFAQARSPATDPPDQGVIPRPRIGFFGVIDERMDIHLVDAVARLRPDWQLVMIGPTAKIDDRHCQRRRDTRRHVAAESAHAVEGPTFISRTVAYRRLDRRSS